MTAIVYGQKNGVQSFCFLKSDFEPSLNSPEESESSLEDELIACSSRVFASRSSACACGYACNDQVGCCNIIYKILPAWQTENVKYKVEFEVQTGIQIYEPLVRCPNSQFSPNPQFSLCATDRLLWISPTATWFEVFCSSGEYVVHFPESRVPIQVDEVWVPFLKDF